MCGDILSDFAVKPLHVSELLVTPKHAPCVSSPGVVTGSLVLHYSLVLKLL